MNSEMYKNCQIFMTFGTLPKEFLDYVELHSGDEISIEIFNNFSVAKILITSETVALEVFAEKVDEVRKLLGCLIFSEEEEKLEEKLVKMCIEKGIKINVAESLTGGLVCSKIVSVSGSSNVLYEGLITYSDNAKLRRLHVKAETLDVDGAISEKCCEEMLAGLKQKDIAISIATTGCAGPNSDIKDTPIGEVYIGVATKNNSAVEKYFFRGMRNYIREISSNYAIYNALKACENL